MIEDSEQKSPETLWPEFLAIINKQLTANTRLKELVERITGTGGRKKGTALTAQEAEEVQNLFIEMEALLGEARAAYHSLFGSDE